jgi:hypothetical protein
MIIEKPLITQEDISKWLVHLGIDRYHIHDNLTVDVDEIVDLEKENLTFIPVQFGIVRQDFYCKNNQLTHLKGCPQKVLGNFYCDNNLIEHYKNLPLYIEGDFYCSGKVLLEDFVHTEIRGTFQHTCSLEEEKIKELTHDYHYNHTYCFYYVNLTYDKFNYLINIIKEKHQINNISSFHTRDIKNNLVKQKI